MSEPAKNILLTASPGAGKTTCIRRVAALVRPHPIAGFFTSEMRKDGQRTGFELVTFDGKHMILADAKMTGPRRVGRYGVDVAGFERTAVETLSRQYSAETIFIIDEIGKMECMSARFREAVEALLDGKHRILAAIARKGASFINRAHKRPDVTVLELTRENRERLPEEIARMLLG